MTAGRIVAISETMTPYPPSFGDNGVLFALSFGSVLAISSFGLIVALWIGRDLWRDRIRDHPLSLIFLFRAMVMLVSCAAFTRAFPEVVYMSCYGDPAIPTWLTGYVLTWKRAMDLIALPMVVSWQFILVSIYPFMIIALSNRPDISTEIDLLNVWPRMMRPALIFVLVIVIAGLMAFAKGSGLGR